jgi:very-short-patch-repair endonuclease
MWNKKELKSRGLITNNFHLPYNPKLAERAKWMRKNMTETELKLWRDCLKKMPDRILSQRPIDNFIVDFFCPKKKIVIEIDGDSHDSKDGVEYDKERTSILEGYGLKIIRFRNEDILNNFQDVCKKISEIFSKKG